MRDDFLVRLLQGATEAPKAPLLAAFLASALLTGCGRPESEFKALETRIASLEKQLEDCRYDPEKLLSSIRDRAEKKQHKDVISEAEALISRHRGSQAAKEAEQFAELARGEISKLEAEAKAAEERRQAEEAKRAAAEKRAKERELASALSKMRKDVDEIQGVTFYHHKSAPQYLNSRSIIEPYIGVDKSSGRAFLRLNITYVADDWLFINRYIISIDGATQEIPVDRFEMKRDNSGGRIWEWLDKPASDVRTKILLQRIASGDKVVIRYEGRDYRRDRTIPAAEKQMIKDVLTAYEAISKTQS